MITPKAPLHPSLSLAPKVILSAKSKKDKATLLEKRLTMIASKTLRKPCARQAAKDVRLWVRHRRLRTYNPSTSCYLIWPMTLSIMGISTKNMVRTTTPAKTQAEWKTLFFRRMAKIANNEWHLPSLLLKRSKMVKKHRLQSFNHFIFNCVNFSHENKSNPFI